MCFISFTALFTRFFSLTLMVAVSRCQLLWNTQKLFDIRWGGVFQPSSTKLVIVSLPLTPGLYCQCKVLTGSESRQGVTDRIQRECLGWIIGNVSR